MKKLLALTLAAFFLCVGMASAEFTLVGDYYAQGTWAYNTAGGGEGNETDNNDAQYGWYDHEMNLDAKWQMTPTTQVVARFEVRDETWAASTATNTIEGTAGQPQSNIVNEQIWGQHVFGGKHIVRVGLVRTGTWGTDFGNSSSEAYRVQLTEMTPFGALILFTQKGQATAAGGSETAADIDNDTDTYFAGLVSKIGNIDFQPSVSWTDVETRNMTKIGAAVALMGTFNNVGWEAEANYVKTDFEASTINDISTYGLYANAWTQLNAFKLGGLIAYGSYDDDVNNNGAAVALDNGMHDFGDDFEGKGAMILGDDMKMGGAVDLEAATLYAVYASYAASEKLTLGAYFGYADSNVDNVASNYDGSSAWEMNVTGSYVISDNLTYSFGAAMAEFEFGSAYTGVDPDEAYEVSHKLAFSF